MFCWTVNIASFWIWIKIEWLFLNYCLLWNYCSSIVSLWKSRNVYCFEFRMNFYFRYSFLAVSGILRVFVVPRRILVLLPLYFVHAGGVWSFISLPATEKHVANQKDGKQTTQYKCKKAFPTLKKVLEKFYIVFNNTTFGGLLWQRSGRYWSTNNASKK